MNSCGGVATSVIVSLSVVYQSISKQATIPSHPWSFALLPDQEDDDDDTESWLFSSRWSFFSG
jgi:hypothetical protein